MKLICAQPATLYYAWQVEVMLYNFKEMGIDLSNVHIVCQTDNEYIPDDWIKLKNGYSANFFFYNDTRTTKYYIPSIRPNILAQHFKKYPSLFNDVIFYHDCDMIFSDKLNWDKFINDDIIYGSNVESYTSYDYIVSKGKDVLDKMVEIIDINPEIILKNNNNCVGAQYLLKNIDFKFWERIEYDSERLFKEITEWNMIKIQDNNSYHPIQIWCADMWAILWNLWKMGYTTKTDVEFEFAWATSLEREWNEYKIYHNAGVTCECEGLFTKNKYRNTLPYNLNLEIKDNTASKKYYEWIKKTEQISVLI